MDHHQKIEALSMRQRLKTRTPTDVPFKEDLYQKESYRVALVSILTNTLLSGFKILAGMLASSGAMVSDGFHSLSDVLSSIIVIIGVKISAKEPDQDHPYGHERFECVAALLLAGLLVVTGLFIGYRAAVKLLSGESEIAVPGVLALAAAILSILIKEGMYWYTRYHAKRLDSGALMADAWHHRSDALSSVGALIGIAGARMGLPVLDTVASLVICLFILKAAYDIFRDAVNRMVDHAASVETEREMVACAAAQEGVLSVGTIQTRIFGSRLYVELEVGADPELTLREANAIALRVHNAVEEHFPKVKHIAVSVVPYEAQN